MLCKLLVLSLLGASTSAAAPVTGAVDPDPIPKVVCVKGESEVDGSAFRISPHTLITAKHVADEAPCIIEGAAMRVRYTVAANDFAVLSDDRAGRYLHISCRGFIAGRHYFALGHGRGLDDIVRVELVATGESTDIAMLKLSGMSILTGIFTSVPGQSGGPIVDAETGEAVGVVNAGNYEAGASVSVALKDTPLCKGKVA